MCMIVTQLEDGSEKFTLCFEHKDEFQPITDFENKEQAILIQNEINRRGMGITLKVPSRIREFSILEFKNGKPIETATALNFEQALEEIGIKVDFKVEEPVIDLSFFM